MLESAQPLFEFEAKQKGVNYRLRLVRFVSFFWLERTDVEDWLARFEDRKGEMEMQTAFNSSDEIQLEFLAQRAVQRHQITRAFQWRSDENLFVTWRSTNHFWFDACTHELQSFTSQVSWHKHPFWTTTGDIFHQAFEEEWQNPECDARDALNFLRIAPQERRRYSVRWLRGDLKEVERVVSAALKVEFETNTLLTQLPKFYATPGGWLLHPYGSILPERLQRLLNVIDERNVRDPNERRIRRGGHHIDVQINAPSMHDKIEARLFLLDWLRDHAPHLLPDWI